MHVIHFDVPVVRDFLLRHGVVYTLRRRMRSVGRAIAVSNGEAIGIVYVEYVKTIDLNNPSELMPYVSMSGFNTVEEWITTYRQINKANDTKAHLYRVVLI